MTLRIGEMASTHLDGGAGHDTLNGGNATTYSTAVLAMIGLR